MAMLEIRDLNVYYGGIHALKGISLEVSEGQIVSMIGSNGAGKSSMMNAISGIVKYKSGEILYKGEPLPTAANKIVKLGVCQVPEGRQIFANLTTYENLKIGAYLRNDKDGIERDLKRVYEIFPRLEERKNQIAGTLSGGEQQMLARSCPQPTSSCWMSRPSALRRSWSTRFLTPLRRSRPWARPFCSWSRTRSRRFPSRTTPMFLNRAASPSPAPARSFSKTRLSRRPISARLRAEFTEKSRRYVTMAKTAQEVMQLIREQGIKMVDFKMVDINGQYRHVTIPAQNFTETTMTDGIGFDASNYGYAVVEKSDMVFIPDPDTAQIDPFCEIPTLSMTGNAMIIDYPTNRPLNQYPRNIVRAAEQYMRDSGIADTMLILPEFEFYLFDDVAWKVAPNEIGMSLDAEQAHWNGDINGRGVIVPRQGHYHIAKPLDRTYECRSEMCLHMEEAGIPIKYHHPEVGGAGQFEVEPKLGEMSKMADASMMIKYIIRNTALKYGKTATFMPKPVYGEAGSGMHVHMLLLKNGEPVFSDDNGYSHLSQEAHWFIGGLLKHVSSLCAITNPSTNSFKRLVPGFEAPVTIGYATSNRSAVIRIPAYAKTPNLRRFEIRNPDATCNPYFCYAALLMAGLDGIENKIDPHENGWGPYDVNLYTLSDEEKAKLSHLPTSLDAALDALEADHDYLTRGGVFPEALLKNFIAAKRKECAAMAAIPHPAEFERYYNL